MKVAMLSPNCWRTPPRHYGPWELVTSLLTESLVAKGVDVTLFATGDSLTHGKLKYVSPKSIYETLDAIYKVEECLHISNFFEEAAKGEYDILHSQFDYLPLIFAKFVKTPIVTTIHGFTSPKIIPVFKKYNNETYYVSISDADRSSELDYISTVYHGIEIEKYEFSKRHGEGLVFLGRIHPDKGVHLAIEVAKKTGIKLTIAAIIQDENYFKEKIEPELDGDLINYIGSVGPEKRNELLANCLATLHLIQFNEPFGLTMVESMACGAPVIVIPRGSVPEIIIDKKTGFFVNNVNEAAKAVEKINTLNRNDCRKQVEDKFTVEKMAEGYIEVYNKILVNSDSF